MLSRVVVMALGLCRCADPRTALIALLLPLAGCYPVTELQTPRTMPAGATGVAVGIVSPKSGPILFPSFDVGVRYGVAERVDVGVRVRPAALEFGAKFQLLRDVVEVSIAPSFLLAYDSVTHFNGDDVREPYDSATIVAGRFSVYVGNSEDNDASVWIAPTIDLGVRSFDAFGGSHGEALVAPGVLGGVVVALGSHQPRLMISGGVLVGIGGNNAFGNLGDGSGAISYKTVLGPGDIRPELSIAVLLPP